MLPTTRNNSRVTAAAALPQDPETQRRVQLENNLIAAARYFSTATFAALRRVCAGDREDVDEETIERKVVSLMAEGRLPGYVDQPRRLVVFQELDPIWAWEERAAAVCAKTDALATRILQRHPERAQPQQQQQQQQTQ